MPKREWKKFGCISCKIYWEAIMEYWKDLPIEMHLFCPACTKGGKKDEVKERSSGIH